MAGPTPVCYGTLNEVSVHPRIYMLWKWYLWLWLSINNAALNYHPKKKKKNTKYKWTRSIIGNHANSIATHLVIRLVEFQSLSENRIPIGHCSPWTGAIQSKHKKITENQYPHKHPMKNDTKRRKRRTWTTEKTGPYGLKTRSEGSSGPTNL